MSKVFAPNDGNAQQDKLLALTALMVELVTTEESLDIDDPRLIELCTQYQLELSEVQQIIKELLESNDTAPITGFSQMMRQSVKQESSEVMA